MKKLISILALAVAVFISFGAFFGCGGNDEEKPPHTHTYVDGKCSCGENDPNAHVHSYFGGVCSCGNIDLRGLLTKETLSNVTITTDEDLTILRRQPIGTFPWFGNESGTSREFRTVKIANGIVEEKYHITFVERVDDENQYVHPVVQEGVFKGPEMSISTHDTDRPQNQEQLSNFERHFDIITNVLERGTFTFDEQEQVFIGREYIFKMKNGCCDSIEAHEVKVKIEDGKVVWLYFDIYVNSHDTVSTWNCAMKSTFIFTGYGTTVIE